MKNEAIERIRARTFVCQENVDTDQIVPARLLVESERSDWSPTLFAGWRFDASGRAKADSPFDRPGARTASVLVAGRNFGCGSSREHAAWALRDFGFRVVIAPELADIFRRNALKNGLVAFEVSPSVHARLLAEPGAEVTVDLESQTLTLPDGEPVGFEIDRFARHCLLHGVDELEFLRDQELRIHRFEEASPRAEPPCRAMSGAATFRWPSAGRGVGPK